MSEQQPEPVPGEDLVIHVPPASAAAGTDSGISPEQQEETDGLD